MYQSGAEWGISYHFKIWDVPRYQASHIITSKGSLFEPVRNRVKVFIRFISKLIYNLKNRIF
jgi:hypothetical protein